MNQATHIIELVDSQNYPFLSLSINGYSVFNIVWNLFLIIFPFVLFYLFKNFWYKKEVKKPLDKLWLILLFCLWLVFMPNTAYIITDVRHILDYCPVNKHRVCLEGAWIPVFFYIYASIGWISFVLLLNQMKDFITNIKGILYGKLFVWTIIPVFALGVLLGLVERWNSWNILNSPKELIASSLNYFTDFHYFKILLIYTISLYILYFVGDKFFIKIKNK